MIDCAPWNELQQGNPYMSNMLFESTFTPAQTSYPGTVAGFNARSSGVGTAQSRGLSAAAAAHAVDTLAPPPAAYVIDRTSYDERQDANNFAEVTFGREALSDRLMSEVQFMATQNGLEDQHVDNHTGVYHAGRLQADAGNAAIAYQQAYVDGPPLVQYRRLKLLTTPLDQLGGDGNYGVDDTGLDVAVMDPGLLAVGMGLSQSSIETARQLGLNQRQTAALAEGF